MTVEDLYSLTSVVHVPFHNAQGSAALVIINVCWIALAA